MDFSIDNKDKVKEITNKLFLNYSFYSEQQHKFLISIQNIKKIIKKYLINEHILENELELMIRKNVKIKFFLDQKDFISILINLCKKLNKNFLENPQISYFEFVLKYFNQITDENINNQNTIEENNDNNYSIEMLENFFETFEFDIKLKIIFQDIYNGIFEIYSYYFSFELRDYKETHCLKYREEVLIQILRFCKDFNIIPYIINLNNLNKYWKIFNDYNHECIFDKKLNVGNSFKLSDFAVLITHFSHFFILKKYNDKLIQISEIDKVLLFLQFLENSEGFHKMKKSKTNNQKFKLIPNFKILKEINSTSVFPRYNFIKSLSSLDINSSKILKYIDNEDDSNIIDDDKFIKYNKNNINDYSSLLNIDPIVIEKIENEYLIGLKRIYYLYAKYGEKSFKHLLNFSSWIKIFQDAQLVPKFKDSAIYYNKNLIYKIGLIEYHKKNNSLMNRKENFIFNIEELKLIFINLTGNKNYKFESKKNILRMNFDFFLKSLECISLRIFKDININEGIIKLFDIYLIRVLEMRFNLNSFKYLKSSISKIYENQIEIIKREFNFFDELQQILNLIYLPYIDNKNNLLSFNSLLLLLKDFDVYPNECNLIFIRDIFDNLILINIKGNIKNEDFLNLETFTLMIILIGYNLNTIEKSTDIDKIYYILNILSSSRGIEKAQEKRNFTFNNQNDFCSIMNYFLQNYNKSKDENEINIDSLL